MKTDKQWFDSLQKKDIGESMEYPIAGLGYFSSKEQAIDDLLVTSEEDKKKIILDLEKLHEYNLHSTKPSISFIADSKALFNEASSLAFKPPIRYHSYFKHWENIEQKKFIREYAISPRSFQSDAFLTLNYKPEYKLGDAELLHLATLHANLKNQLLSCLREINLCNGMEELVLLVRLHAVRESEKLGYYVIAKKANYNPFYYSDEEEIPKQVLDEKRKELGRLFEISKMQFMQTEGELGFREWEKDMARIDSLERGTYDITHFEPYPSKPGNREFILAEQLKNLSSTMDELKREAENYELLIQKIYPYHIILQNCTGEIFRYHNQFYPDLASRQNILGGSISEKPKSLSFVPFLAAMKVSANYNVTKEKEILSYRRLKKREQRLSYFANWKEDLVPLSSTYQKNPYDQEYIFFTDDTILLRPLYGITNILWGFGHTTAGIFIFPWDRGKKFTNGVKSVFFSFPELLFFNIRKGYFPYITQKDLPLSYYEQVNE